MTLSKSMPRRAVVLAWRRKPDQLPTGQITFALAKSRSHFLHCAPKARPTPHSELAKSRSHSKENTTMDASALTSVLEPLLERMIAAGLAPVTKKLDDLSKLVNDHHQELTAKLGHLYEETLRSTLRRKYGDRYADSFLISDGMGLVRLPFPKNCALDDFGEESAPAASYPMSTSYQISRCKAVISYVYVSLHCSTS